MKFRGWIFVSAFVTLSLTACSGGGGEDAPCVGLGEACLVANLGQERCNADNTGVETCLRDEGEPTCAVWTATETCIGDTVCDGAVCRGACENECTAGESQCQGVIVIDCLLGEDGCTAWEIGENCADSGLLCSDSTGEALCVAACENDCTLDDTRCVGTVIEVCENGTDGCSAWVADVDCADDELLCNEATQPAVCAEDCANVCTLGATRCLGSFVQACINGPQGCTVWQSGTNCTDTEQVCLVVDAEAQCLDGCEDECSQGETYCNNTIITGCVMGADFCTHWQDLADCADNHMACASIEAVATCYRLCDDQCATGDSQCADNTIQTCAMGEEGCNVWVDGANCVESGQVCNFSTGTALCDDSCEDVCTEAASRCSGTIIDTCVRGNSGCTSWQPGTNCVDAFQICEEDSGTASCEDACQNLCGLGESICASTVIQTCIMGELGCTEWLSGTDCADTTGWVCDASMGAAICVQDCENLCVQNQTQCDGNLLQYCSMAVSGCTEWMTLSDCADDGQVCDASGEQALCRTDCGEECTAADLRCNGNLVETCAAALDGCLVWTLVADCDASGGTCDSTGGAHCSGGCENLCTEGDTRCSGTIIQGCIMGLLDCTVWSDLSDCADLDTLCELTGGVAYCTQPCVPACTLGDGRCWGTVAQACVPDADNCPAWSAGTECADTSQVCVEALGSASCEDACENECDYGSYRCVGTVIQTCMTGAFDCTEWRDVTDCADDGQVCDGSGPVAYCADACADLCEEGDSRCAGEMIQSCVVGADDCTLWSDGQNCADTDLVCRVEEGTAVCVEGCTDLCSIGDSVCAGTVVTNCVDAGEGCGDWSTGEDCADNDHVCDVSTGMAVCIPLAIGWCRLQYPDILLLLPGEESVVYGRVFIQGLSNQSHQTDAHALVVAQAGYGTAGTQPGSAWTWFDATPNPAYDDRDWGEPNNDEYMTDTPPFTAPNTPSISYSFAYRFSADNGATWTYCDKNMDGGAHDGSADGYQTDYAGLMMVLGVRAP
ncbi:MAG: hypothetical protein JRF33_24540 [Deltaproteobacteria bacterium]|nr:hypothetical protein [Deltaproteobacteria bacterium]